MFGAFLHAVHLAAAHELPALIARHAAELGGTDAVAYLTDLQQVMLVPFVAPRASTDRLEPIPIDSTLAGRAFQLMDVQHQRSGDHGTGTTRLWLPLLNGTERLGVLRATVPTRDLEDDGTLDRFRDFAALVAEFVMTKSLYSDVIVRTRRLRPMGLAAEMQWGLLPPLTFASDQVVVAGALEPAYEVAGDSVDYTVDDGRARFAVFDSMGHGLASAQLAVLAVASYRNSRRHDLPLVDTARAVDRAVHDVFGGDAFSTALMAELDTDKGVLTWVNAGHPDALLLRGGHTVKELSAGHGLPLGLGPVVGPASYELGTENLQPGDRVLAYTDGVIEARSPDHLFFGIERLVDLLNRNVAGGLPAPETMRRVVRALLTHQQGQLDDDATMLLVEWRSGTQERLLP